MPAPQKLFLELRRALGSEAAEMMVNRMDESDERRNDLEKEIRTEVAGVRHEIVSRVAALREDPGDRSDVLRQDIRAVDGKVDQLRDEMRDGFAAIRGQFAEVDAKFTKLSARSDAKFAEMNAKFVEMNAKFERMDANVAAQMSELRSMLSQSVAEMTTMLANRHGDFVRWTLGFWIGSLATLLAGVFLIANYVR